MSKLTEQPISRGWLIAELVLLNGLLVLILPVTLLSFILAAGYVRTILEIAVLAGGMILVDLVLQARAIARRLATLGDRRSKGWLVPFLSLCMWPLSIFILTLFVVNIERSRKA